MPALLTRMSRPPKRSKAASIIAFTSTARVTSQPIHCVPVASATRRALPSSRSAISTFAPSAANLATMPSPKPEPPPVTIAVLPCSLIVLPSSMVDCNGLQGREAVQRLEALFASMARSFHAAKRQLDPAARAVVVDEHLAALQGPCHAKLPRAVARPHACDETVHGAVGDADRVGLGV